ncbi:nucleotide-sugar transporter-domain-containing protein [Podospora australis]|uniref:Nucleotide-sugar transporter-domain-containing protein n=1 Tax=Podospora australis TaxID=1536484 RepID=A0AAN7AMP0_9PEZI|nr:nucleotide-sugar transporter-domain-containing protein [Podospora australis]
MAAVSPPSASQRAGYLAAASLVAVQVGSGILLKTAQHHGHYEFSPSGSVAISEFVKLLISLVLFYLECRRRLARGKHIPASSNANDAVYTAVVDNTADDDEAFSQSPSMSSSLFWRYIQTDVTSHAKYGFANLSLLYMLINNIIFLCYQLADPATIQLLRSGMTFITAVVSVLALRAALTRTQWIAIALQICGLAVTQYHPTTGSTYYSLGTYAIIVSQVFLGAVAGVYNQHLLKLKRDSSLHANNIHLYGWGVMINLAAHLVIRAVRRDEPGFLHGYTGVAAVLVIANNVLLGLVISFVYKYADAIIKCFSGAVATGILLCVSPLLFGTSFGFLVLPGSIVVFTASWLYMTENTSKGSRSCCESNVGGDEEEEATEKFHEGDRPPRKTILEALDGLALNRQAILTTISAITAIIIMAGLTLLVDIHTHTTTTSSLAPSSSSSLPPLANKYTMHSPCGSTPTEAREHGCRFDINSFCWLPPPCDDEPLAQEFDQLAAWEWYRDENKTQPVSREQVATGEFTDLHVSWEYHLQHCTFMWRKLHRAILGSGGKAAVDSYIGEMKHTRHCSEMLLNYRDEPLDTFDTFIVVKYPHCGLV